MNYKLTTMIAALLLTGTACSTPSTSAMPATEVPAIAAPAGVVPTTPAEVITTTTTVLPEVIEEDDPRWDCATMGNRICGPQPLPKVKDIVKAPIISNHILPVSTTTVPTPDNHPDITIGAASDANASDEVTVEPVIDEGDQWVSIDPPARPLPGSDITYSWTPEKPWNVPSVMDPRCGDYSISYQSIPGCMTEPNEGRGDGTPS